MIVCFDLDGTICETDNNIPVPERYYKSTVIPHMRDVVKRFHKNGHTVMIDTARRSSYKGIMKHLKRRALKRLTEQQLAEWGVPFHSLRVGVKPPADIFIDDRGIPPAIFEPRNNESK